MRTRTAVLLFIAFAVVDPVLALWVGAGHAATNSHTETFLSTTYKDAANTTADWDTGTGSLHLYPFAPILEGTYATAGSARDVAVDGRLGYVIDPSGLTILDIGDPTTPALLGTYATPDLAQGVAVAGDLAFIADNITGLIIVDVSDPANPTLVGTYNTPGNALKVTVDGDFAFVADNGMGLRIIDISNPASPTLAGGLVTPGLARAVAVAGNLAFVAAAASGLQIVDITDPTTPVLVGGYDTPGYGADVAVDGDHAFVADGISGLQIIDITNPASPTPLGTYNTPDFAAGVAVSGDVAYVGDDDSGVQVIDITNPASPVLAESYDTPGQVSRIAVSGALAFAADGASGLAILRMSIPVTQFTTGVYDTPGYSADVTVAGDHAFVADTNSGLQIIDVSNPVVPTLTGTFATSAECRAVAVAGDLAFASDHATLRILDISDPANPALVGSHTVTPPNVIQRVVVAGDLVLMVGPPAFYVVDVSNPASPSQLVALSGFTEVYDLVVAGDFVYQAEQLYLTVYDISDPANPVGPYSHVLNGIGSRIVVAGDLAFVAATSGGLRIFNVANVASMTEVGSYQTGSNVLDVAVAGDRAYLTDADHTLTVIDITNPAAPTHVVSYQTSGYAYAVTVNGENAFIADGFAGLTIVRVLGHEFYTFPNVGGSTDISPDADAILRARVLSTETPDIDWEITADGGANWQTIVANGSWNTITVPGDDLRWRSTLNWTPGLDPTVSDLQVDWLYDYPVINAVTDIPGDQGGHVRVEWTRSNHDFVGEPTQATEYAVYRKIDPAMAAAAARIGARPETFQNLSPAAREHARAMLSAGWDFVVAVPVVVEDTYSVVVPTLRDSTIVDGQHQTTFFVSALTATPGIYFDSPPDSGYSVDNLAPAMPSSFAVAYNTGTGNTLSWDDPVDADFQYFRVYRSSDPNFTPGQGDLVHATVSPAWTDPDNDGGAIYYKITAVDHSGNESDATGTGTITAAGGPAVPSTFALHPNVPNPFNPETEIRYDVPEGGGAVTLRIYDVAGRLVRTLVEGTVPAGARTVRWNGSDDAGRQVTSGVYFCRLTAPNYTKTQKMVLMK